jgi:hypothetical protein
LNDAATGSPDLAVGERGGNGPAVSRVVFSTAQVRRMAVAAHLARFKGQSGYTPSATCAAT